MRRTPCAARCWATTAAVMTMTALAVFPTGVLLAAPSGPVSPSTVVLSFGSNSNGRTGLGTSSGNTLVPTPINTTSLAGRTITQVAAGFEHSLLLTDDGVVFAFGSNDNGRTGLGTVNGETLVPTLIDTTNLGDRVITQVAAGSTHSLLLADDGSVFSFGRNGAGATGRGTTFGNTPVAAPIDTSRLMGRTITQIAAGPAHSLLLADDGTVFAFGANAFGRTGLGGDAGSTTIATPIVTTHIAGRTIVQTAAGTDHSLLLADDGTVFAFGKNLHGRTGLGTDSGETFVATPIDTTHLAERGIKITQVAAGTSHSLVLADDGTVYAFGSNGFGQTGLGTAIGNTLIATPIDSTNLADKVITQLTAGWHPQLDAGGAHSLLLDDDGTVFSFGSNGSGRTGLGTDSGITVVATPVDTTNLAALRVIGISAVGAHSLLLAVPEPGGATLLLLAGLPLLVARKRNT